MRRARLGWEPQPGLALLRLAQGDGAAAAAAIRRALGETTEPLRRAGAAARVRRDHARRRRTRGGTAGAARARGDRGRATGAPMLRAMVAQARGAVLLARRRRWAALVALRQAQPAAGRSSARRTRPRGRASCSGSPAGSSATRTPRSWSWSRALRVPASSARRRTSRARRSALRRAAAQAAGGLTARELEVLRLVASGKTQPGDRGRAGDQREDRGPPREQHLHQARVSSRAAATAYAYEHDLV